MHLTTDHMLSVWSELLVTSRFTLHLVSLKILLSLIIITCVCLKSLKFSIPYVQHMFSPQNVTFFKHEVNRRVSNVPGRPSRHNASLETDLSFGGELNHRFPEVKFGVAASHVGALSSCCLLDPEDKPVSSSTALLLPSRPIGDTKLQRQHVETKCLKCFHLSSDRVSNRGWVCVSLCVFFFWNTSKKNNNNKRKKEKKRRRKKSFVAWIRVLDHLNFTWNYWFQNTYE